jgi:outer membrane scaffolding protein for murein synthesis (MipA/OmpV family)
MVILWRALHTGDSSMSETLPEYITAMKILRLAGCFLSLALSTIASASTEEQPLWELGGGVAAFDLPHYLGADQSKAYVLPVPYFVYRGDYIRADRQGIRGLIYNSEKLDLRMSLSGSLPVNSKDNDAREGMDDLDLMLEAGPTLQYILSKSSNDEWRIDLPVRGAFTVGGEFMRHQGWIFSPALHYERDLASGWIVTTNIGPVYADQRYNAYFYDVDYEDVLNDRPYFQSSGGYLASRFAFGVRKRFGEWFVGSFLRYYDLNNAANENSPLVKKDDYVSAGVFVGYVFAESKRRVKDHDRSSNE